MRRVGDGAAAASGTKGMNGAQRKELPGLRNIIDLSFDGHK
jgi:hypothetical protein